MLLDEERGFEIWRKKLLALRHAGEWRGAKVNKFRRNARYNEDNLTITIEKLTSEKYIDKYSTGKT